MSSPEKENIVPWRTSSWTTLTRAENEVLAPQDRHRGILEFGRYGDRAIEFSTQIGGDWPAPFIASTKDDSETMYRRSNSSSAITMWVLLAFLFAAPVAQAASSLEDTLLKKGVITKEEWLQIKADQEQEAEVTERAVQEQVDLKLEEKIESEFPVKASWRKKGLRLESRDGKWATNLQWRAQMRYSFPFRGDPRKPSDFSNDAEESTFEMRRVRMKVGGHGYQPWLKYYFELDLQPARNPDDSSSSSSARLIDWRIDLTRYKWLSFRLGQWKINYNRERVDSSGRQQFVERSIVNRIFAVDRQVGAMAYGRLFPGTLADMRYYAGVFTGTGRGTDNDDNNMMYMGRLQWNFLGRDLKWRQSDVSYHEKPAGSLAFAASTTLGPCTRWSSGGCGNLDGFTSAGSADDGQFRVTQMVGETAFKWKGFSFQQEFHWKKIEDRVNSTTDRLIGSYAQAGYFFHNVIPVIPPELELAIRYAFVDEPVYRTPGDRSTRFDNNRQEFTLAANYFFDGHRNKVTLDVSHLTLDDGFENRRYSSQRARLQGDSSF